jgi:hypothetical protein
MDMKNYKIITVIFVCAFMTVSLVFAAEQKQPAKPAQAAQVAGPGQAVKQMTPEEVVKELTRMLNYNKELIKLVPGLEMVKDDKGNIYYTYKQKDGKVVRLEDLDRETLESIFLTVRSDMIRRNTEMTTRQMREIKRIQDMNRQARELRRPVTTTTTYKPPALPPKVPKPTYTPTTRRTY